MARKKAFGATNVADAKAGVAKARVANKKAAREVVRNVRATTERDSKGVARQSGLWGAISMAKKRNFRTITVPRAKANVKKARAATRKAKREAFRNSAARIVREREENH